MKAAESQQQGLCATRSALPCFITVRLLRRRVKMTDGDFAVLAQAFNRARARHPLLLTAWVFLPDHWHAICAPRYPETVSRVVKSVKQSSTMAINRRRAASGELWQPRFFDRALLPSEKRKRI